MAGRRIVFPSLYFTRDKERDFHDDGNNFKVWKYKGVLPISYLRSPEYGIFASIRADYLLPFKTYSKIDGLWAKCNEFNGCAVEHFNMKKFIDNCEFALNAIENII